LLQGLIDTAHPQPLNSTIQCKFIYSNFNQITLKKFLYPACLCYEMKLTESAPNKKCKTLCGFFVLGSQRRISFILRSQIPVPRSWIRRMAMRMRVSCSYRCQLLIIAFAYYFPFIAHVAQLDMPSLGGAKPAETLKPFIFCTLLWHIFFYPASPSAWTAIFISLKCL